MIKKILINAAIFLGCTIVFLIVFFPYAKVLEYYANIAAAKAHISLSIGSTEAGAFGADLSDIKIGDFAADSLELRYSPFSVLTRSISAKLDSEIATGEASHKGGEVSIKTMLELDKIPQVAESGLGGEVILNLAMKDWRGTGTIAAPKLTIPSDFGPVTFNNITGNLAIEKQMITVSSLTSEGTAKINLNGNIRINQVNANRSVIALAGTVSVAGMNKRITITGQVMNPKITVN
jgi:hypothetical protein